ncbi:hypothetical protein SAMN04487897_10623 [Paenibacillus sp. yr247]|uniref:hypothetical protein n=1 Tax=Paenibacillus sp. yr247 TaxID=1761880 RepID=UPI00087FBB6D|nr:hypothetical protein [Paenibacillus sp. yr247]SDN92757.1 hypothetical protein SAMN04487897_10623 [Paenibacillus sp. yr247]
MKYHVISKRTGNVSTLFYTEVNDMDYDSDGRVIVFGTDQEAYYLLADSVLITED